MTRSGLAALAVAGLAGGCDVSRQFACEASEQCVRGGVAGVCLPPGFCAFDDGNCDTGLRWDSTAGDGLRDTCVGSAPGGPDGASPATNVCGGTSALPAVPGNACGLCDSGRYECAGPNLVTCEGEADLEVLITDEGAVAASTEFSGSFRAELGVDGDLTTSWFSSGPEGGGAATVYQWSGPADECVTSISIRGNGNHDNAGYRTDYGFSQVTVQVVDAADAVVFSQVRDLDGTPDPPIDLETGGVVGRGVRLLLIGHEADDCGGFSELTVGATR